MSNFYIEQVLEELDNLWNKYRTYRGYYSTEQIEKLEDDITLLIDDLRTATF